jgi:hypothetical protein
MDWKASSWESGKEGSSFICALFFVPTVGKVRDRHEDSTLRGGMKTKRYF